MTAVNRRSTPHKAVAFAIVLAILAVGYVDHGTREDEDAYCKSVHDRFICSGR